MHAAAQSLLQPPLAEELRAFLPSGAVLLSSSLRVLLCAALSRASANAVSTSLPEPAEFLTCRSLVLSIYHDAHQSMSLSAVIATHLHDPIILASFKDPLIHNGRCVNGCDLQRACSSLQRAC